MSSASPISFSKFRFILSEDRSARELRQNFKITLIPLLVREYTLWENDLSYLKKIFPPQSIIRQEIDKEKTEIFSYINKEIPSALPKFKSELLKNLYLYSEFSLIFRINYTARMNFPKDLISLIKFFK
jgi:hypothetical protein